MQFPSIAIFLLVFARCAGALLLLPPWNWRDVPVTVRLGLAGAVAIAITPLIAPSVAIDSSGLLIAAALRELMVGLTFGFMGALVFWGALLAGQVIEHYVGSGAASGFAEGELGPIARLYYLLALMLSQFHGGAGGRQHLRCADHHRRHQCGRSDVPDWPGDGRAGDNSAIPG